jgi:hypothetical protein
MKCKILKIALVLLALAQFIDVWTTNRALAATNGGHEENPIMAFAMADLGHFWWLPKVALAVLFLYFAKTMREFSLRQAVLTGGVAKIYLVTLIANYFHLF